MLPQKLLIFITSPYLAATYHPCYSSQATHPTILLIWLWSSRQGFLMLIAPRGLNACPYQLSSSLDCCCMGKGLRLPGTLSE